MLLHPRETCKKTEKSSKNSNNLTRTAHSPTVLIKYSSYMAGSSEMPVHFYLIAQCHILYDSICIIYKNIEYHIEKSLASS
jgi:hypothetical protein